MQPPELRRPLGATILAVLLAWLAVAGFGNAVVWNGMSARVNAPANTPLAEMLDAADSPLFAILALAYGVTALVACVGIWRLRPWMVRAYVAWMGAVGAQLVWISVSWPSRIFPAGRLAAIAFGVFVVGLLSLVLPYLNRIAEKATALRSNNTLERARGK